MQMLKNYGKHELSFVLTFGRTFLPGVTFCPDGFGSPQLCFFPGPFKATKDGCKKQQTDIWSH